MASEPGIEITEEVASVEEFTRFYESHHGEVVRWAALVLGSDAMANDVVHDAFIEVWRRWARLERPSGYLRRCVAHGCRDVQRRDRRSRARAHLLADDASVVPTEPVFDLLDRLPFNQRAAVVLRFYGGLTEAEIAETLGARPGSVGPWITRALRTLRKELA